MKLKNQKILKKVIALLLVVATVFTYANTETIFAAATSTVDVGDTLVSDGQGLLNALSDVTGKGVDGMWRLSLENESPSTVTFCVEKSEPSVDGTYTQSSIDYKSYFGSYAKYLRGAIYYQQILSDSTFSYKNSTGRYIASQILIWRIIQARAFGEAATAEVILNTDLKNAINAFCPSAWSDIVSLVENSENDLYNSASISINVWEANGCQTLISGIAPYEVAYGNLQIIKEDELGYKLSGAKFKLYLDSDCSIPATDIDGDDIRTVTTGSNGKVTIYDLLPGTYYIKEISAPTGYINPEVVVKANVTADVTYKTTIVNEIERAIIEVYKTGSDYTQPIEDVTFQIIYKNDIKKSDGTVVYKAGAVAGTVTTNSAGKATLKDLYPGIYIVREIQQGTNYQLNQVDKTVILEAGSTEKVNFTNIPVKGSISIHKVDTDTDTRAQGDATLQGAVYELYANATIMSGTKKVYSMDDLVATFPATDSNGYATLSNLYMGSYYIKEKSASTGYLINSQTTIAILTVNSSNLDVAVNVTNHIVNEQVMKGKIEIKKFLLGNDYLSYLDPLISEEGAVFKIWLQSAGSFNEAYDTERDIITTDSNGYAISSKLPYGTYTVEQVNGAEGYAFANNLTVYISKDGVTLTYNLTNPLYKSQVIVEKIDAETGKIIQIPGVRFRIYDANMNLITLGTNKQSIFEVSDGTVNDAYGVTMPIGTLLLPEYLDYGTYYLEEVEGSAPEGYIRETELIEFNVTPENASEELNGGDVIRVEFYNAPVKGKIEVYKEAEQLVNFKDGQFKYELKPLSDCVFEVYAAEDIYTPDMQTDGDGNRNKFYTKDELIGTITTGADGKAELSNLPLGSYYVKEISVPAGYVLNEGTYPITLRYVDENTPITTESITVLNERQKIDLEVIKLSAFDDKRLQGAEFTVYAYRDVVNYAGEVIVTANSEIATITTDSSGKAICTADLPYVIYSSVFNQDVDLEALFTDQNDILESTTSDEDINVIKSKEYVYESILIQEITTIKDKITNIEISIITKTAANPQAVLFYLQETKAPEGYYLNEDNFAYINGTTMEQTIAIKLESKEFKNEPSVTKISKVSMIDDSMITGAALEIRDITGKVVDKWNTDGSTHITYALAIGGTYTLVETKAPDGFVTADPITFTVNDDGMITTVIMKDDITKVEISKVDITNEEELPGATLVIKDSEGNKVEEWISGDKPYSIEMLPVGEYTLSEIITPDGYVTASTIKFTIEDTGKIQCVTMKDDVTKVEISKQDITTGEELPGATLQIVDNEGNVIDEWVSTEEVYYIEKLPVGDYILRETIAPDGYEIAEEIIFRVEDTGEIQRITMHDKPIEKVSAPKTSDIFPVAVATLFLFGSAVVLLLLRKRKVYIETK